MSGGPQKPDLSGYNYGAISSLVITADRSTLPRRDQEPDGAPTSLARRIDPREMGSGVRLAPQDIDKKEGAADKQESADKEVAKWKTESAGFGYTDIIEATQDVEGLTYRPRTAETRAVYELILSSVHRALGDKSQDIVRSAADIFLATLKDENMKDFDKKEEVEDVLGSISSEQFSQFVNLFKKITDCGAEDETMVDPDMERKDAEIDEVGEGFEVCEDSDDDNEEG